MVDRVKKIIFKQRKWLKFLSSKMQFAFTKWRGVFMVASAIILAAFITLIGTASIERIPERLQEGMIANRDIKADRNYEIVNEEATSKLKEEAKANAPLVYSWQSVESLNKQIEILTTAFLEARNAWVANRNKKSVGNIAWKVFVEKTGSKFTPQIKRALIARRFSIQIENWIIAIFKRTLTQPIVKDFPPEGKQFVVVDKSTDGATESKKLFKLADVKKQIKKLRGFPRSAINIASELITPNCSLDEVATAAAAESAAEGVKDVIIGLKSGEMIIRHGARFNQQHIMILESIRTEKQKSSKWLETLGIFGYIFILIVVPFKLGMIFFQRVKWALNDYLLMIGVGLASLGLLRLGVSVMPAIEDSLAFSVPSQTLTYAIPMAGAAMLLRLFLTPKVVLIFSIALAGCSGIFPGTDILYTSYILITNLAAIMFVSRADHRGSIMRAGVFTGLVGVAAVICIKLIFALTPTRAVALSDFIWYIISAFMSGIISSALVLVATPIVEHLTGYASDIKLLELANLNHPLLRELIVRSPGTYHHSHLVGVLGEAAAESVGANALLVRVAAYYHDIGKLKKPQYFVENVSSASDRHEKLTPQMSSLILLAHVKDGLEMATKNGLPKVITDMIPEHHGTRIMRYFYDKALNQEDTSETKVEKKDFRYPGPKPQSREAAILMLADTTEAATRALKEKTPSRIQQTVEKCINDIFTESQLDECDLTLKDLTAIGEAFTRILLGIYHQRIEYPSDEKQENNVTIPNKS